jgi:colanic acid/amylovoran biosynthesis glycosyltransferase
LRNNLEKLAANLLKKYRFLGVQTPETVKTWMNKAKMLVAPSITTDQGETEGLPIVILEAMSMGLPVISTVHAGIPEAVKHQETGFLTQEKDTETIAKYIRQLDQDSKLRKDLGIAGQNQIKRHFNIKMNTIKLENIYNQI